jgi:hypothetical protein
MSDPPGDESVDTTKGKLQLMVSSRKVLARVERYDVSFRTSDGQLHVNKRTARIYDYVLDEGQTRALRESRELARRSGLTLEVTDLSRESALGRMLRVAFGRDNTQVRLDHGSSLSAKAPLEERQEECEGVISLVSQP